jgi:hypothetical protein
MLDKIKYQLAHIQYGKVYGIVFCVFGFMLLFMQLYFIKYSEVYHPKVFVASIVLSGLGLTFLVFSGGKFCKADYENQINFDAGSGFALLWQLAPKLHRFIWVVAAIVFFAFAMWCESEINKLLVFNEIQP